MENKLSSLKKIKRVNAPEFLYNKILEKIEYQDFNKAPKNWQLYISAAAIILILLNIGIIVKMTSVKKEKGLVEIANIIGLTSSNDLYNE